MRVPLIIVALVLFVLHINEILSDDVIMQRSIYDTDTEPIPEQRRKKPFCNAFTGCGRKRSDESLATMLEMNSEPAVEELNRQILSETKLWQAIQEAGLALLNKQKEEHQAAVADVPIPILNYKRKRHCGIGNYYC